MAHLGIRPDDAGSAEISGVEYLSGLMYPYLRSSLDIILAESLAQFDNHVLDALESLPRISELSEIILSEGMIKVIKVLNCIHQSLSFFSISRKYL